MAPSAIKPYLRAEKIPHQREVYATVPSRHYDRCLRFCSSSQQLALRIMLQPGGLGATTRRAGAEGMAISRQLQHAHEFLDGFCLA